MTDKQEEVFAVTENILGRATQMWELDSALVEVFHVLL